MKAVNDDFKYDDYVYTEEQENMKAKIYKNYKDFLNRDDQTLNGVSPDFAKKHPDYIEDNTTNTGCWNCWKCTYCSDCIELEHFSGYLDCRGV